MVLVVLEYHLKVLVLVLVASVLATSLSVTCCQQIVDVVVDDGIGQVQRQMCHRGLCSAKDAARTLLAAIHTSLDNEHDLRYSPVVCASLSVSQITVKKFKSVYGIPVAELRSVTCRMRSHSVTCHPTQMKVNLTLTPARQASTRFIYSRGMES